MNQRGAGVGGVENLNNVSSARSSEKCALFNDVG